MPTDDDRPRHAISLINIVAWIVVLLALTAALMVAVDLAASWRHGTP